MAEQEASSWDILISGTGRGPDSERKEKVLRCIIHRLNDDATSLQEVLQEEYVRCNCTQSTIEEILTEPELVHAARERMEGPHPAARPRSSPA